jgi:hypothetical protein
VAGGEAAVLVQKRRGRKRRWMVCWGRRRRRWKGRVMRAMWKWVKQGMRRRVKRLTRRRTDSSSNSSRSMLAGWRVGRVLAGHPSNAARRELTCLGGDLSAALAPAVS